jgi:hypothetical protein
VPPGAAGAVGAGFGFGAGGVAADAMEAAGSTPTAIAVPPISAAETSLFMVNRPFRSDVVLPVGSTRQAHQF